MAEVLITVEGEGADAAIQELLAIPGLSGMEFEREPTKEGVLATVAAIIGITVGVVEISERIYKWYHNFKQPSDSGITFDVLITSPNGRLLLEDATIEEICQVLKFLEK